MGGFYLPVGFLLVSFSIPTSPQSADIGQNSDVVLSDFRISGQSLTNKNCHNSGTRNDINTKFVLVTKLDKRNKTKPKNLMASFRQIVTSFFDL